MKRLLELEERLIKAREELSKMVNQAYSDSNTPDTASMSGSGDVSTVKSEMIKFDTNGQWSLDKAKADVHEGWPSRGSAYKDKVKGDIHEGWPKDNEPAISTPKTKAPKKTSEGLQLKLEQKR